MARRRTVKPRDVRAWEARPDVLDAVGDDVLQDILTITEGGPLPEWVSGRITRPRRPEWADWWVRFMVQGTASLWLLGVYGVRDPELTTQGWWLVEDDGGLEEVIEAKELADALLWAVWFADGMDVPWP